MTAEMIAAPFLGAGSAAGDTHSCPVSATRFEGTFGDAAVAGTARFWLDRGLCRGSISAEGEMGVWLNSFPQKDAADLAVIALRANGSLERAALVTPIGAHQVRRGADGSVQVDFGSGRLFRILLRRWNGEPGRRHVSCRHMRFSLSRIPSLSIRSAPTRCPSGPMPIKTSC